MIFIMTSSQNQSVLVQHTLHLESFIFNPVSRINSGSWVDQFSNMIECLEEFFQDLCGIPIESHWNYQGIEM